MNFIVIIFVEITENVRANLQVQLELASPLSSAASSGNKQVRKHFVVDVTLSNKLIRKRSKYWWSRRARSWQHGVT